MALANAIAKDWLLVLRDGTGFVQCVVDVNTVGQENFETAKRLTQESSLSISGIVKKDEKQFGGFERLVKTLFVSMLFHKSFRLHLKNTVDFLMDNRHLWLRSRRQWAIMRVRNTIIFSIHKFFQEKGFVQMDAPYFYRQCL